MRIVEIRECAIPLKSQPAQLELRLLRKQICPDSAGPFIVSILLALLFSLFGGATTRCSRPRSATDYDHFRDFRLGFVRAEGIDHTWLTLGHHEVFARFTFNREWDVSELSFAKFMAQVTRDDPDIIGLPVVCSRLFRFSSFYVNKNSNIKGPADLKGKTIGSPEWAHTAAVYMRGWLTDEHGVRLQDVHWYQAGANEAGRTEEAAIVECRFNPEYL